MFINPFQTIAMVDESLKLLQLDYVDNVLIHFPALPKDFDPMKTDKADPAFFAPISSDPERAPEARIIMWEALQKCILDGKVRHIGVSNFCRKHIEKMVQDPRYGLIVTSHHCYCDDIPHLHITGAKSSQP